MTIKEEYKEHPIHLWFSLTYSSYLVLPRSVLQSMPYEWQDKLVKLLEEIEDLGVITPNYKVYAYKDKKRTKDYYQDYNRGRRNIFEENYKQEQ